MIVFLLKKLFSLKIMHVPITKNMVISWVFGTIFGLSVSLLTIDMMQNMPQYKSRWSILDISERGPAQTYHGHAHNHKDLENATGPDEIVVFHKNNESVHKDEDEVARKIAEKVRVLCWVMTQPLNHKSKVQSY